MKLKHLIYAISIALLPLAASAATFIVPAAGTGPGANDSRWQSELTLHNTGAAPVTVGLRFHDRNGAQEGTSITLAARNTVSISDVVKTRFGRESATGGIEITVPDTAASRVTITSRTFNTSAAGEFGQDIPAISSNDAANAGDVIVLQGPSSAADYRFNFGVYALTDTTIRWEVVRADGNVTTPLAEQSYAAGTQLQFNNGVQTLFNLTAANNDAIHAVVTKGKVIAYGSAINNASGDPTFVPGIPAREDIHIDFKGVDLDENGTVDVVDADHDGVLDQAIDIFTSVYPNYFRVVVDGPATLELVDASRDVVLIDANTVQWAPGGALKGTTGVLRIRATVNGVSEILTIPANFR